MDMTFVHPQTTLNILGGDTLGTLVFIVYAQLSNIPGVLPVTISCFGMINGSQNYLIRPCGPPVVTGWAQSSTSTTSIQANPTVVGTKQNLNGVLAKDPQREFGGTMKKVYHSGRHDVPHFEDTSDDLRSLFKRVAPAWTANIDLTQSVQYNLTLDIANDILFPNGEGVNGKSYNGCGLIGWYSPFYRYTRGDTRIKVIIQHAETEGDTQLHGWATAVFPGTSVAPGANLLDAAPMLDEVPTNHTSPRGVNGVYFISTTAVPYVLEVEVPRVALPAFTLIPAYSKTIAAEAYAMGSFRLSLMPSFSGTIRLKIYASFADATTMGGPWMLPNISIITGNYPDHWLAPVPPTAEESDSDMEVIQVVAPLAEPRERARNVKFAIKKA